MSVAWIECPDTRGYWAFSYVVHGWVWDAAETRHALFNAMTQSGEYDSKGAAYAAAQRTDLSWGYAREDEELEDWVPCASDEQGAFKATWAVQP